MNCEEMILEYIDGVFFAAKQNDLYDQVYDWYRARESILNASLK